MDSPVDTGARVFERSIALDVLRIFAAFWVVAFHWSYLTDSLPSWLHDGMRAGYLGVDIFFMLSGAVIIHTAVGRTWSQFAQSRFLRLFPVYVAATLLTAIFLLATDEEFRPPPEVWLGLTGVQFWVGVDPIIWVAWTLRYEVGFYVLVAILILASRNAVTERSVRIGVYGFLVVWLFASATHVEPLRFVTLDQYGPMFILGVLLGISRDVPSLRANGPAIFVAAALTFHSLLGRTSGNGWTIGSQVATVVFVLALSAAVILWSSLRAPRGVRVPWLHRGIVTLSLMTYPIYLLHNQFGFGVTGALFGIVPVVVAYAAGAVAVLGLSYLSVRFFEPWARARLRALFGWGTSRRPQPVEN